MQDFRVPTYVQLPEPTILEFKRSTSYLINRACRGGEDVVCVRANQSDGTDDKHEDHGKHHGVLRDVLPVIIQTRPAKNIDHGTPLADVDSDVEALVGSYSRNRIAGSDSFAIGRSGVSKWLALTRDGTKLWANPAGLSSNNRLISRAKSRAPRAILLLFVRQIPQIDKVCMDLARRIDVIGL
jgi:hypothetical protein